MQSSITPQLIDLEGVLAEKAPRLLSLPEPARAWTIRLLRHILRIDEIGRFLHENAGIRGVDLIDEIFEMTDFSFYLSARELERIPSHGRVVCMSNHPLGGLDGLLLLRAISQVRPDVQIVANDTLGFIEGLNDFFLPVEVFNGRARHSQVARIDAALEGERPVIFFPAGEVSRPTLSGIRDRRWSAGAVRFAQRHQTPILPLFVEGRNSLFFYSVSLLAKPASTMLLPGELLRKHRRNVRLRIGELIPPSAFAQLHAKAATKLVRKQAESLVTGRKGPFRSESGIALPIERRMLRRELENCQCLGSPAPGKLLYLAEAARAPAVVREIARLREVTFRHVGEGTGRRLDMDRYDRTYRHLFVWDEQRLEIAGAYRLGFGSDLLRSQGPEGFYTRSLFDFSPDFASMLPQAVELGRSFVQRPYWNSHVLEYLWAGIGTILSQGQRVRYLFGPVSISKSYPAEAQHAIVFVFRKWFSRPTQLAASFSPFHIPEDRKTELQEYFCGTALSEDLNRLKLRLGTLHLTVPMLLRQYTELCEQSGVTIADFGVDDSFGSCVDGFIVLDLAYLTEAKRLRYIERYRDVLRYASQEVSAVTVGIGK